MRCSTMLHDYPANLRQIECWFSHLGDRGRYGCVEHAEICYRSRACGVHVKNIGWRRSVMHAVIRSYSGKGTKALFELLEKNKGEVESLIRGVKGFVSFPRAHHSRRVLGLGLPGQGWCRREHSGSTGADRQECQQNWCGPTNYLGRHSHAAIEVNLSLSETYALRYWWCSPPRTLRAISNHCDEDALTLLSPSL